jgi:uncharacterized membrane protein
MHQSLYNHYSGLYVKKGLLPMPDDDTYDVKPADKSAPEHPLAAAVKKSQAEPQVETSEDSDQQIDDIRRNRGVAVLAYIGPMVFVPLIWAKDSRFARHHTNQGLILFLVEACLWGCGQTVARLILPLLSIPAFLWLSSFVSGCLWGVFVLLSLFGVLHVVSGSFAKLPAIGQYQIVED